MKTREVLKQLNKKFVTRSPENQKVKTIWLAGKEIKDFEEWFSLAIDQVKQEAERETIERVINKISNMEKIGYKRHSVYIPSLKLSLKSETKEEKKQG